jgi:hypothetical protein
VRSNQKFPCRRRLPDGSFLSEMKVDSTDPGAGTVPVRVIEYTLKGVPGAEPVYRLITTILDAQAAPALAALYHERWEAETTLCEIKVRLPGRRLMLRSRSVELVWQELYGLALTHFALRDLMHEAALVGDCDVDTLSFTNTVKIVQSHVALQGSFPPVHHPGTRMKIIREILRCPAEQSRGRHNARSVKRRTQSSFPNKKRKRNVSRTSTTYDYKTAIYIFPN